MKPARPKLIMVAGANGSGKSTLTKRWKQRFSDRLGLVFDPDAIAYELNPKNPRQASLKAARAVLNGIEEQLQASSSFLVETTLSDSNRHLDLIAHAQQNGFRVWLFYVGLEKPELSFLAVMQGIVLNAVFNA